MSFRSMRANDEIAPQPCVGLVALSPEFDRTTEGFSIKCRFAASSTRSFCLTMRALLTDTLEHVFNAGDPDLPRHHGQATR